MSNQIKFRNYQPQTSFLDGAYIVEKSEPESLFSLIEDKLKLGANQEGISESKYAIDLNMLEPKKIDYDLKCRLEKNLEKLDRQTRRCIDKARKKSK